MKLAVYLRVSTSDKQDTSMQMRDVELYCKLHGHEIVEVFEDRGFTGRTLNRPGLQLLLEGIRAKKNNFNGIIVWKFDRFARSLGELISTLKMLSQNNIEFISIKDNIDFSTPHGKLMLHIVGAFAEFESDLIRLRVNAGMDHAKKHGTKSGKPIGRPLKRNDLKIREEYSTHNSYAKVAKILGIPKSQVARSIQSMRNLSNKSII